MWSQVQRIEQCFTSVEDLEANVLGRKTAHLRFVFRMMITIPWKNIINFVFLVIFYMQWRSKWHYLRKEISCLVFNIFSNVIHTKRICYHEINLPPQSITVRKDIPEVSWRMKKSHTSSLRSLRIGSELKCKCFTMNKLKITVRWQVFWGLSCLQNFWITWLKNSNWQQTPQKPIFKTKHTKCVYFKPNN